MTNDFATRLGRACRLLVSDGGGDLIALLQKRLRESHDREIDLRRSRAEVRAELRDALKCIRLLAGQHEQPDPPR